MYYVTNVAAYAPSREMTLFYDKKTNISILFKENMLRHCYLLIKVLTAISIQCTSYVTTIDIKNFNLFKFMLGCEFRLMSQTN